MVRQSPIKILELYQLVPKFEGKRANNSTLKTYDIPQGVARSTLYDVKVRTPGGIWRNIECYKPQVVDTNIFTGATAKKDSSMAYFDFSGPVEVSATYNNGSVKTAQLRPKSLGINPEICGANMTFVLHEPKNLVLQVNDDIFGVLNLFTNSIEGDEPTADEPDLTYYGPGLHTLTSPLNITSGHTTYLAGGAVMSVPGINFYEVDGATLRGRGVLMTSASTAISITRSQDVTIDGIIGINVLPRSYQSNDVTIRNFRAFSSVTWGDGIDVFCSKNIFIDNVFLRTSDDSIAIYNHRDEWYGDNSNITLQNSILWADVAHPINMGTHGNTENPETTDGVFIRNIDILDQHEKQMDYQGCIAINPGDSNLIQNVVVNDVRVEDIRLGQLINLRVIFNEKYNTSPGRGIRNVSISNLSYDGTHAGTSIMHGYDSDRAVEGVTFYNLTVNGLAINDKMQKPSWYRTSDYIPMYFGPFSRNITFSP
ncbi:putative tat pathway signal sequence domain protein [Phaeoacremonium minimum UCRPA7]|uniref:Putative tat pathway signal sequence domain protein n=1 Tax=Phaeoacremonium minimum (strain UCR-PA7) TaxID=1286976 RepID=R8BPP6_PHAM7|nr:putative tat pathway signal sequence domain protein [Phaeoacremonium minimum UCRPA7]EOO01314.1 putative tat pathway signal sequence domain protein [Phaeoacremonium minimum UCRPA7]